jgi:hypothetical protein
MEKKMIFQEERADKNRLKSKAGVEGYSPK